MYVYMYHIFFIHSSVDGHLGCFHVLAIVNSAAVNIGVYVSFRIMVFSGYKPRSEIAGSYGSSIFSCFLKNFYLFMVVLGLRFCVRAFSSCGKWGPLFIAVRGPLTMAASLVVEQRLQTRRLSNFGSWA